MRELELILALLAARVMDAHVPGGARVLDAGDFKIWLVECAKCAAASTDEQEFFKRVDVIK